MPPAFRQNIKRNFLLEAFLWFFASAYFLPAPRYIRGLLSIGWCPQMAASYFNGGNVLNKLSYQCSARRQAATVHVWEFIIARKPEQLDIFMEKRVGVKEVLGAVDSLYEPFVYGQRQKGKN